MISLVNPISDTLHPRDISRQGLVPQRYTMHNGQPLYYFTDTHIDLVRFDIVFEAGTAIQHKKLQAMAAIHLITEGTAHHSARQIAEFLDYRGIVVEKSHDSVTTTLTVYSLSRYLDVLLPLLFEMVTEPAYPQAEFDLFIERRRQKLLTSMRKTSFVARNRFWAHLYGPQHPLGSFAEPDELDLLRVDDVRDFHRRHMQLSAARLTVSGHVDDALLHRIDDLFGCQPWHAATPIVLPPPQPLSPSGSFEYEVPQAVQNSLRVGRLLPYRWDDVRYAQFMVLSTLLGGYFGSRLMSNIREDKGYTYGIYAMTQMCRGSIVFYILSDVASDKAQPAMEEILKEIGRLRDEAVGQEELALVRNNMMGDFMRSVDGIFERAERYGQMCSVDVDERFTDNFMSVLTPDSPDAATPEVLQSLAQEVLRDDQLVLMSVGQTSR